MLRIWLGRPTNPMPKSKSVTYKKPQGINGKHGIAIKGRIHSIKQLLDKSKGKQRITSRE
jgi:hypothetical protein